MSRVKEMIRALRKCAEQHEGEKLCTGQTATSLLCRDVADYLEADRWHYPSRGEYPKEGETVLVAFQEGGSWYFADAEYHEGGWASAADLGHIIAWQYIIPPKEEA